MKTFYITTPLYYINAKPHLGHAYTTIVADCLSRYKEMQGFEVRFLTGTDEHGQNIERAAAARGITPSDLADQNSEEFRRLWSRYGIEYTHFIRTSEARHYRAASEVFRRVQQNGFIYKGEYSGWYCISDNLFAPESELPPNCEVCGRQTERVTEESYFFKLSEFQQKLLDFYEKTPDLSISRTSVKWGVPVPADAQHVIYVWFDALVGYLTGIGFGDPEDDREFRKFWPAQIHLVGKDIIRFHTVYWPAFLMAAGLQVPHKVFAHGWWLKDEAKMSKSRGNVVDPNLLLEHFGGDAVRYFLMREIPLGLDGTFSYDAVLQRANSDLANDYGNLVSRTLTLISKNFNQAIPYPSAIEGRTPQDNELEGAALATVNVYQQHMEELALSKALESVWELLAKTNRYLNESSPWSLTEDLAQRPRLATILYTSAEVIRIATVLLAPFLPESSKLVWKQLGLPSVLKSQRIAELKWGGLPVGGILGEVAPVFPRFDKKEVLNKLLDAEAKLSAPVRPELTPPTAAAATLQTLDPERVSPTPGASKISIEDLGKIDLRVGQVITAERVKGADKLLKLMVDLGTETRQILAGVARFYSPEALVGRKIIVVANLEPRKLRGLESNGMLLAASVGEDDRPVLAGFLEEVPNGAKLR